MTCSRCAERREALKRAAAAAVNGDTSKARSQIEFVASTSAEDVRRAVESTSASLKRNIERARTALGALRR